ncbi:hypothetical protein E5D57_009621 [Metarhizium anisopliae]|nr:hypothetical protein E5D57_009621 [Metarhizium anisopliae]
MARLSFIMYLALAAQAIQARPAAGQNNIETSDSGIQQAPDIPAGYSGENNEQDGCPADIPKENNTAGLKPANLPYSKPKPEDLDPDTCDANKNDRGKTKFTDTPEGAELVELKRLKKEREQKFREQQEKNEKFRQEVEKARQSEKAGRQQ